MAEHIKEVLRYEYNGKTYNTYQEAKEQRDKEREEKLRFNIKAIIDRMDYTAYHKARFFSFLYSNKEQIYKALKEYYNG